MKKIVILVLSIVLLFNFSFVSEARTTKATQDVDYVITYQYYNVYEEYGFVKYQAIVQIQNISNQNLYLNSSQFDFYDAAGNIVASEDFISNVPSVIAPNEKGYFYNDGFLDAPAGNYNVIPTLLVQYTNKQVKRYPVSNTSIANDNFGDINVVGIVGNDTAEDDSMFYLNVIMFNEADIPIAITGTNIMDLYAGTVKGFEISGMLLPNYIKLENVKRYEIIAEPFVYQY